MRKLMLGVFATAVSTFSLAAHADWQNVKERGAAVEQKGKDLQEEGKQMEKRGADLKSQGEKAEDRAEKAGDKARDEERSTSDKLHDTFDRDNTKTQVKRDANGNVVEKKSVHKNSDGTKTTTTTETK